LHRSGGNRAATLKWSSTGRGARWMLTIRRLHSAPRPPAACSRGTGRRHARNPCSTARHELRVPGAQRTTSAVRHRSLPPRLHPQHSCGWTPQTRPGARRRTSAAVAIHERTRRQTALWPDRVRTTGWLRRPPRVGTVSLRKRWLFGDDTSEQRQGRKETRKRRPWTTLVNITRSRKSGRGAS